MTTNAMAPARAVSTTDIAVETEDRVRLAATLYEPAEMPPAHTAPVTVISSGAAIPRGYYRAFAMALASRSGGPVITYDYRGIGGSLDRPIQQVTSRMSDWGRFDAPALVRHARKTFPKRPLHWVGHSYGGGFAIGLNPLNTEIDRLLGIAVPHGYWRDMTGRGRIETVLAMGGLVPLFCSTIGYLPGKLLGIGEDLPGPTAREWASWIMSPNSMWDTLPTEVLAPYESFRAPLCYLRPDDDQWASAKGTRRMAAAFPNAAERHVVDLPTTLTGGKKVGHIGFFRHAFADTLWPAAFDWLDGTGDAFKTARSADAAAQSG
jgi:predicted alpha/beta hydrolase